LGPKEGRTFLDQFRILITEIGNALVGGWVGGWVGNVVSLVVGDTLVVVVVVVVVIAMIIAQLLTFDLHDGVVEAGLMVGGMPVV